MPINSVYLKRYKYVNATSDGANTVIENADTTRAIYVVGYALNVDAAGTVTIQDSAGSPAVVASFSLLEGGGAVFAGSEDCPAFKIPKGLDLVISNGTGVDTTGHITYILAP